jgi:RNA polymerase sigma factor (sigma-70 family)
VISTLPEDRLHVRTTARAGKKAAACEAVQYVYHPSFSLPDAEEMYWGVSAQPIEVPAYELPPEVAEEPPATFHRGPSLNTAQERTIFFRYNYAKFRLRKLLEQRGGARNAREADLWRQRAEECRGKIVHANLALVVAMAKRMQVSGVEFAELISEGNVALLRSVEKFDAARGFKFSTYACRSILTCFHRLSSKAKRQRERFPVEFDVRLEKSDHLDRRHEDQRAYAIETVRRVLFDNRADLTNMEHRVILERFPMIPGEKPRTLAQVGLLVGLTNERVRQIEKKSLIKIRLAMETHYAA